MYMNGTQVAFQPGYTNAYALAALTGLIAFERYKCAVLVSLLSDVCVVCPCPLLSFFTKPPPQPPPLPPTSFLAPPPPYVPPDLSPSPEPNIIYSSLALCREQIDRPDDGPPDTVFYAGETLCIDQTILGLPAGAALVNHTVLVNGTLVTVRRCRPRGRRRLPAAG
jgi:hypothetical protein